MERTFTNFLKALRGADVPVSVADTLDAMEVAKLIGWEDREKLKTSLSFALAKSEEEKYAFSDTFDDFFRADSFRNQEDDGEERERAHGFVGGQERRAVRTRSSRSSVPTSFAALATPERASFSL